MHARKHAKIISVPKRDYLAPLLIGLLFAYCFSNGCRKPRTHEDNLAKVGLVLAIGGLGDNSVNDSAYAGLQIAKEQFSIEVLHVEPREATEFPDYLHSFGKSGTSLVFGIGFSMKQPMEEVAKEFPNTIFAIIDVPAEGSNVVSLVFREHEGAFLAGALAASMSRSKRVGFLGGMDIPLLRKWQKGFEAGVAHINPEVRVDARYIDVVVKGFSDPIRGKEMALAMYAAGSDVILQVTGGSATGVYAAAKETGKYVIGSDQNQDGNAEGLVLTSVVRDVERLVIATVERLEKNVLKGGVLSFGLKERGIHLTDFEYTRSVIGEPILQMLKELEAEIIEGRIQVPDYTKQDGE